VSADNEASRANEAGTFESLGRKIDERPEVQAAEEALRRARDEFERAQEACQRLREEANHGFPHVREKNVSDLVGAVLAFVRKNPGPGVVGAAAVGYILGRLFRR
jgi:ElaB/YqjD/DUF883 family membrane-anchored ribosome-binding protein